VATCDVYGGTHRLFTQVLPRCEIAATFVDLCDLQETRAAIRSDTKLLWIEKPTNPVLRSSTLRR